MALDMKQFRRDKSRARFLMEQMENSNSNIRKFYYGIQSVVFSAIWKERYKEYFEKAERELNAKRTAE